LLQLATTKVSSPRAFWHARRDMALQRRQPLPTGQVLIESRCRSSTGSRRAVANRKQPRDSSRPSGTTKSAWRQDHNGGEIAGAELQATGRQPTTLSGIGLLWCSWSGCFSGPPACSTEAACGRASRSRPAGTKPDRRMPTRAAPFPVHHTPHNAGELRGERFSALAQN
jgi:hypothetical protein